MLKARPSAHEAGHLTPEDGQRFIDFLEKWGELPTGEACESCARCGRIVGHMPRCDRDHGLPPNYIVIRGDSHIRYFIPEVLRT